MDAQPQPQPVPEAPEPDDAELLRLFREARDRSALETFIRRHADTGFRPVVRSLLRKNNATNQLITNRQLSVQTDIFSPFAGISSGVWVRHNDSWPQNSHAYVPTD